MFPSAQHQACAVVTIILKQTISLSWSFAEYGCEAKITVTVQLIKKVKILESIQSKYLTAKSVQLYSVFLMDVQTRT